MNPDDVTHFLGALQAFCAFHNGVGNHGSETQYCSLRVRAATEGAGEKSAGTRHSSFTEEEGQRPKGKKRPKDRKRKDSLDNVHEVFAQCEQKVINKYYLFGDPAIEVPFGHKPKGVKEERPKPLSPLPQYLQENVAAGQVADQKDTPEAGVVTKQQFLKLMKPLFAAAKNLSERKPDSGDGQIDDAPERKLKRKRDRSADARKISLLQVDHRADATENRSQSCLVDSEREFSIELQSRGVGWGDRDR